MNIGDRIKELRISSQMSQQELADKLNVAKQTVYKYENGIVTNIPSDKIEIMASLFHVSPQSIMGWDDTPSAPAEKGNIADIMTDIHMIPLFDSVSAGFGAYADSQVVEFIPVYIGARISPQDYIAIRVKGDSMYPKIENGDIVVVHKQDEIDSGDIGVVLIDGDDAYVKKIQYDRKSVTLVSLNPEYQDKIYKGEDISRIKVVGKVWKIIKEL